MNQQCQNCGEEAKLQDDLCSLCLQIDPLDEEDMLYQLHHTDMYYTESIYEAGGTIS